jgi:hypothetical protein
MVTTVPIQQNGFTLWPEKSSLSRLRYFFGQLLTQRDLEVEQRYHLALQRMMQREAFGTGTTAGLRVVRSKDGVSPPLGVFVQPGLAFDPDGRELVLENEECIDVAIAPVAPTSVPFSPAPTTKAELATAVEERFESAFGVPDLDAVVLSLTACGLMTTDQLVDYDITDPDAGDFSVIQALLEQIPVSTPTLEPPTILRDWIIDQLVGVTYIGLQYRELGSDPSPAVLDASCCGDLTCFPSRTSQGVFIVTSQEPFPAAPDPYTRIKECIDTRFFAELDGSDPAPDHVDCHAALCECLTAPEAWRGVPPVDEPCGGVELFVVCLAQVCWRRFIVEDEDNVLTIDNCACRKLAPGGPAIRALVESLTGCAAPANLLPRIVAIEPEQGATFTATETIAGVTVRARVDAIVDDTTGSVANCWELLRYPPSGGSVTQYDSGSGTGPGGSTITAATFVDPGSGTGRAVEIVFSGGTGFEPGTYVWRLPLSLPAPGIVFSAVSNSQQLDAEPNPPAGVPSGNGLGGGTFEARFVVVPDPT